MVTQDNSIDKVGINADCHTSRVNRTNNTATYFLGTYHCPDYRMELTIHDMMNKSQLVGNGTLFRYSAKAHNGNIFLYVA